MAMRLPCLSTWLLLACSQRAQNQKGYGTVSLGNSKHDDNDDVNDNEDQEEHVDFILNL